MARSFLFAALTEAVAAAKADVARADRARGRVDVPKPHEGPRTSPLAARAANLASRDKGEQQ